MKRLNIEILHLPRGLPGSMLRRQGLKEPLKTSNIILLGIFAAVETLSLRIQSHLARKAPNKRTDCAFFLHGADFACFAL